MMKPFLGLLLAVSSLARAEAWVYLDEFEVPRLSPDWVSSGADLARDTSNPGHGEASLRCDPAHDGAWFGTRLAAGTAAYIAFWVRSEREGAIEIELRRRHSSARFWRKIEVAGGVWQEIVVPVWRLRTEGVPRLSDCDLLAFRPRGNSAVWIDGLRVMPPGPSANLVIEPRDSLSKRAFGGEAKDEAETPNFRVLTDAEVSAKEVSEGLEEFLGLFQDRMGLPRSDLEVSVTLVIHATREAYVDFVARTAKEVYGGVIDPKGITAGGFTFERYSCTSYDPEQGAMRPVFYHEACHQIVTQCLGLRGPNGASWAEEGVCYYMQNEYLPQANLAEEVGKLLENPKRPALAGLKDTTPTTSGVNMTGMLVIAFLAEGPHKGRLAPVLAELRDGHHDLARAVDRALGMKIDDFAAEWEAWVRETYR